MELFSIRLDHAKGCLHLLLFGCSEVAAASCHQASRDIIGCEVAGARNVPRASPTSSSPGSGNRSGTAWEL